MFILLFLSFWLFVLLCWCFDLWGYCLSPKTFFFQNGLSFRDCEPSEIYISLSCLYKCGCFIVKYVSCTICIFLRNTGKHDMCSGQKSDIVWCYIFRSYCSFNQHGEWNSTAILTFLLYVTHLTDSYTEM